MRWGQRLGVVPSSVVYRQEAGCSFRWESAREGMEHLALSLKARHQTTPHCITRAFALRL